MSKKTSGLKSRAISADKAVRCCRYQTLRAHQTVLRLVGDMLDTATDARADGVSREEISLGTVSGKSLVEVGPRGVSQAAATEFEKLLMRANPTEFERLLQQGPKPNLKINRGPAGSAAGLGSVVLIGAQGLSSVAAQAATIETLTGVLELLDTAQPDTDGCERCVRKGMWKQTRKQVKETGAIRRRQ